MSKYLEKVCPVVLRRREGQVQFLAFRHPLAGNQIVKGTIEPGESSAEAAMREIFEESGLNHIIFAAPASLSTSISKGQRWHFLVANGTGLPDEWDHFTLDDGGHTFSFFWQTLNDPVDENWHPIFHQAIDHIRSTKADWQTLLS